MGLKRLVLAAVLLAARGSPALGAMEPAPPPSAPVAPNHTTGFIRFVPDGREAGRVETAARTYRDGAGVEVTLFAAVHVADRAYYAALQQRFEACDALLYEMIRDEGEIRTEGIQVADNPVSQLQLGMKALLELEFQLEAIDYARTNFVHADLDPATFQRLQTERRESMLGLMLRTMLEEEKRERAGGGTGVSGLQLLWALMNPERGHTLKLLLGRQMGQLEETLAGLEQGSDGRGSVIVSARNARAMEVLRRQVEEGRRRLGIFYGAGHMPDFDRRLRETGYRPVKEEWLSAWEIRRPERRLPPVAAESNAPPAFAPPQP